MRERSSKTSFALAALALVVALMAPTSDGLLTESYVRLQLDPDTGGRIVTLVDFERIVNFVFDPDNNIVNCQVAKRNEMGRKMIILEEEDMTGGINVQYFRQEVDVALYGRKCSKYLRNNILEDLDDPLNRDLRGRQHLAKGVSGTKFCASGSVRFNSKMDFPDLSPADMCCKEYHNCPSQVPEFNYRFSYLNVHPHRLMSCDCVDELRSCLGDHAAGGDSEAAEVSRLFFEVAQVKCSVKESVEACGELGGEWFDECKNATIVSVMRAK